MQGIKTFIPTSKKVEYINQILNVGFDTVDFGSFVNPKAIPQMADTSEVVGKLDLSSTSSKLLSIIANKRGAEEASEFDQITYLGYPFSVSETENILSSSLATSRYRGAKTQQNKSNKAKLHLLVPWVSVETASITISVELL